MDSIDITYFGQTVSFPNLPRYRKFYARLEAGAWEPATFEVLRQNIDDVTTYVDVGGWIGATPFWAAGLARQVIVVEPDPVCLEILKHYAPRYPNLTLLDGALATNREVELHGVDEFGSSESSLLESGDGQATRVKGLRVAEIMRPAGPGPVFVKIDIEGYEYAAAKEIARFAEYDLRGVQLAVHPQLLEKTLPGGFLRRRLRTTLATWRLGRIFSGKLGVARPRHYGSLLGYCLFGVLLRRVPKHTDFVFLASREPSR
ncbi:MAG: FkbM family methyltransferase [Rhizobiales bacterium]|nr:FkbM family methyltransferase [Hyphomicrobiales bacterium]